MLQKKSITINGKNKSAKPTHRSIADVAWNQFVNQLNYKAEEAGGLVIKVDPRNTTKACSVCGKLILKDLSVRVHICSCGYVEDRDLNAAKNILRLGLQSLANRKVA
jgi:putative transposase